MKDGIYQYSDEGFANWLRSRIIDRQNTAAAKAAGSYTEPRVEVDEPCTDGQWNYLQVLKHKGSRIGLSKKEASRIIGRLKR